MKIQKSEEALARIEKIKELYNQGVSVSKIAETYGMSRQRVYQLVDVRRSYLTTITEKQCIYTGLRNWMNTSRVSISSLVRMIYGDVQSYKRSVVSNALRGGNCSKKTIDRILKVSGLTYEEAFGKGDVE